MKSSRKFALVISFATLALSGCGNLDFSETLLRPLNPVVMSKAQGVEVVSGSAIGQKTVINGYTVDASVGAIQDKLVSKTPNGYRVYNGVRGAIVSDQ